jgi:1,4-alpha-glucan branching enzyme
MLVMSNKKNGKKVDNIQTTHAVRLEFKHPTATQVAIAGTFNDWRPEATLMIGLGEGRWIKELVLPPGRYEYLLVTDGKWMPDPQATETVPNPFGGMNSVIHVPNEEVISV